MTPEFASELFSALERFTAACNRFADAMEAQQECSHPTRKISGTMGNAIWTCEDCGATGKYSPEELTDHGHSS